MKIDSIRASTVATLATFIALSSTRPASSAAAADASGFADKGAVKAAKQATNEVLATCTEEDFLASGFEFTDTESNTSYTGNYTGCYTIADTNDDDEELSVYSLSGNLTTGGATFYASNNNDGLDEPIWYFVNAESGASVSDLSGSFLCYDLDLNSAADIHPAEVTSWGVIPDSATSSTSSVTCDISITCGCSSSDDDDEEDDDDDDAEDVDDAANAAFGAWSWSNHYVAVASGGSVLAGIFASSVL